MKSEISIAKKRWIRPLSERLINKIAAGEVIERPAAVLKELVENSLDAGATRIDMIIEKSGTRLIAVADNGCGIPSEQIEIAFARHATSKINDFNDLENLRSYGFRGEALPSIASVSRTRMISRAEGAETGVEIIVEGGVKQSLKPVTASFGTKVEVENLFFNTPARRKFLKAETTEARHLTRNAIALALGAPAVRFSYALNERTLFALDESHADLKTRTAYLLLGKNQGSLFEIISQTEKMEIAGFLSHPEECRQNQYSLFIFINGRYIRSQSLNHAVTAGYGEVLPRGNYPVGAVFLTLDPSKVDVNVHPTKAEVRLSDEKLVHDLLYQAVKRSLRGESLSGADGIAPPQKSVPENYSINEAIRKARAFEPGEMTGSAHSFLRELYGPSNSVKAHAESSSPGPEPAPIASAARTEKAKEPVSLSDADPACYLGQFSEMYLLFKIREELLIIDQHAAHERILYEEIQRVMEQGGAISQNLLFPLSLELSADRYLLFEESAECLQATGFILAPFGGRTVILSAVPAALSKKSPEKIFLEIIDDMEIIKKAGNDFKKGIAQSIACRSAVMAGDRLSEEEAYSLLRRLMLTEKNYCCPHGRPTTIRITRSELDVRFSRK